ncbi:sensor histidine kinase [Paraburkholderia acidisoli]|uniref:histidine kinase n=1 Tax=Paraburkholderia acidisoli TaxID=2571748 RepID=A0A7Z2JJU6_9BURK|nr:HAMP domain-containing sensor histidine kinase [Paraburkholderia acidisoli]QGZ65664.1 HAMP domain-containing protein [Paraburkholderia acidisoli]
MRARNWRPRLGGVGWLLLVFAGSACVLFALLYWLTSGYLLHEVDERLRGEFAEFHSLDREKAIATIDALSRRDIAATRPYGVFEANGTRLAGNVSVLSHEHDRTPFEYTETLHDGNPPRVAHYRGIVIPTRSGLRIVVGHSIDEIRRFDATLLKTLGAGVALASLLAFACGAALHRLSNRRIAALGETAREIMAGKLNRRLPLRGTSDDLDRLAVIVNTMLDEIERLVDEVRGVCAGVAHDLRTPMTSLRAGLERARRRGGGTGPLEQAINVAMGQADIVLNRFSALLRIAEIESGSRRASFRAVSLDAVLRDVVELYEPLAEHNALALRLASGPPIYVSGDVDLLFGAIDNLLDNALKFTPAGGAVTVSATLDGGRPLLVVADSGPGIAPAERGAVLRMFYRGRSFEHSTPGHGLGLSLVAAIARVHDATLEILDNAPGCRLHMRFERGLEAPPV